MPTRTAELQYLRRILAAHRDRFLHESGSDHSHEQYFYKYNDESIFLAQVEVSGAFKGEHWKSLTCVVGIYYRQFPGYGKPRLDPAGRPIPTYRQARLTIGFERTLDQSSITSSLSNPILQYDRNIWHVLEDESNLAEVLHDMAVGLREVGYPTAARPTFSRARMLEKERR